MNKLVLATKNKGKEKEIRKILEGTGIELLTLDDFPLVKMPPEEGATFTENAISKARHVAKETGLPALADDSGLEVDSLQGRPGVYSARYAGEGATDKDNYLKLLSELEGVEDKKRTARFKCSIAFISPDGVESVFEGTFEGIVAKAPSGERGFGYDPVFFIPELGKTAAEIPSEEKNKISHRAKALKKLKEFIAKKNNKI